MTVLAGLIAWTASWATTGATAAPGQLGSARIDGDRNATAAAATNLPETVVDLVAADMGGGGMMGGSGGWMVLRSDRLDIPSGTASLRLTNAGSVDHELVVLPLAAGSRSAGVL